MFRKSRITILLFLLFLISANAYLTHERTTGWDQSLSNIVIGPQTAIEIKWLKSLSAN